MKKPARTATRETEAALFRRAMEDVKPLGRPRAPRPLAHIAPAQGPPALAPVARPARRQPAAAQPNPGIDRRTQERVKTGAFPIEARLDLHGLSERAAHAALLRFVADGYGAGRRMLLVVTGRGRVSEGGGVIKRNLRRWLEAGESAAHVLSVAEAQPRHGGAGAFYVYLRRRREG